MNYKNIKTSKQMNESVKEQLLFRDDHLSKYAVKRIEELEKLCISSVSQQRETLNGFKQWLIDKKKNINIYPHLIDEYLKTI